MLPQAAAQSIKTNIWGTLFPLVILSFHNQQNDDIHSGRQTLRYLWTTRHAHTHTHMRRTGTVSLPTQNFCDDCTLSPVLLSVYISSVRAIPDCDPVVSAAFSVPHAVRVPGIKLLARFMWPFAALKPFKRMEADTDLPPCQQAVKCSPPEFSLLLPSCWNDKVRNYPLVPKSARMFIWKLSSWKIKTVLMMRHLSRVTLSRIWHNCHISPNRNLW